MTPSNAMKLMRQSLLYVLPTDKIIETYDPNRPGNERIQDTHIQLTLKALKPMALPSVEYKKVNEVLESVSVTPCELFFDVSAKIGDYALDISAFLYLLITHHEVTRLGIENGFSVLRVDKHEREPTVVHEKYEESSSAQLVVAFPITTESTLEYADSVEIRIYSGEEEIEI